MSREERERAVVGPGGGSSHWPIPPPMPLSSAGSAYCAEAGVVREQVGEARPDGGIASSGEPEESIASRT